MPRIALNRHLPAAVAWALSIVGFVVLAHRGGGAVSALDWLGVSMLMAAVAGIWAAVSGRIPLLIRQRLPRLLVAAAGPVLLLVAATGGLSSHAVLLAAVLVLGIGWKGGSRYGMLAAGAAVALLVLADAILGRPVLAARGLSPALAILGVGLLPLWHARRASHESVRARSTLARVEGYLATRRLTPHGANATPSELRGDWQEVQRQAEGMHHLEAYDDYLRTIRDTTGADEVIFWRWDELRQMQRPAAWSTEDASAPAYFDYERWAPLVRWATEAGVVHCDADGELVRLATGPVHGAEEIYGALSLSAAAGLTASREGAKAWVERHAAHLALLAELFEVRRNFARETRQSRALLRAAERINEHKDLDSLASALCETALEVSSGSRAAYLRWDGERNDGLVQVVSPGHALEPGMAISPGSVVAEQCASGRPLLMEDAATLERSMVYGRGEPRRRIGTLLIAPMLRPGSVGGALVVEGDRPGAISRFEHKNLAMLAAVAAGALEILNSARSDRLTGLYNRLAFDDELTRVLAGADRVGAPAALIVADVDRFKSINDRYGHEAGDAVLKHVAKVFRQTVRASDLCARYGGEELAVLLPHTALAGAEDLANRLRRAVEARPVSAGGVEIPVTASFGVASYPEAVRVKDALFPAADRAMYRAKGEGRNCVRSANSSGSVDAT